MTKGVLLAILIIVTSVWSAGCSRYETWEAKFIGINKSFAKVIVTIDGIEQGALLPTATANFMVRVTSGIVPNSMTGASSDRRSTISISIKNAMNDKVSVAFCPAGERLKTTFIFESNSGYDWISCSAS